ncbi:MAG TPA: protein kinase [Thermoanaerobaculia bacterium]|nr:protein kinase [Thermoanaerobaculia bacterium]
MSDDPRLAASAWPRAVTPPPSEGDHEIALILPGTRMGPFEIEDRLGAGGMGEVYRARDSRLGRSVALKVLPGHVLSDREGLARFAMEARSASALNHPNIVTIFEIGEADSAPYLAMELIEGWTLRHLIEAGLPIRRAVDIAAQIAEGLAKAHQAGIVHRDLKPENVMVTRDGFAKILDFGLAKLQKREMPAEGEAQASLTQAGFILGTPDYMSPEQASGRPLDFRSDQFSAGLIFYEMLTRKQIFHRATAIQTLSAIIQEDPEPLDKINPRVPPPLRWTIERCLAKDPEERYSSTKELARDLKQIRDNIADFPQAADRRVSNVPDRRASRVVQVPGPSQVLPQAAPAPTPEPAKTERRSSAGVRVRRTGEFVLLLVLGAALFAGGALIGHWFRGREAEAPPPVWKAGLLAGPMTRVMAPRLSPDGQTLAFVTLSAERSQVAVMKPSSGDWILVTKRDEPGSITRVCWSRDGNKLFFDRVRDVALGIYSVPPLGGEERLVLEEAQGPEALPDGSLLVIKRDASRNFQVHRLWPDSGKLVSIGPAVIAEAAAWSVRAFPDGARALFWGKLVGDADPARHVYILDLESGHATRFAPQLPLAPPLAVRGDGTVLAVATFGDLQQIVEVSAGGEQGKILFPVTGKSWSLDAAADGSVYVGTLDNPAELLRFPPSGGVAERITTIAGNLLASPLQLPDSGILIPSQMLGRRRLLVSGIDGRLRPFLDLAEQAMPPATLVGDGLIAFLSGRPGQPSIITVATVPDGRIVRRIESTRGAMPQSLVASPDGKQLFYVDAGTLFSVAVEGGPVQKLGPATSVAVDPHGPTPSLITQVVERDGIKLYRSFIGGGGQLPILHSGSLRLAGTPLSGAAVGPDGRIAVTVTSPDSWFRSAALLDPTTASLERVPLLFDGDVSFSGWTREGSLLALGISLRTSLWRFQPQIREPGASIFP